MSASSNTRVTGGADSHESRARARIGQVLRGKWRLDSLLGVGGMAAVYAATHRNQKRGAVKILHAEVAAQPDAQQRFVREGYVANSVDHEGVVSVLDDDVSDDGCAFLVMELLKGESVSTVAERWPGERVPAVDVLQIADELLDILAAAHQRGIVHRDLKPENLFLTHDRKLKVLDFGIAKLHELSYGGSKTATGTLMGTPAFMPPEQALGEWSRVDARSDLWAVGATMFNLLTGKPLHDADTMQKLLLAHMTKPPPPLLSVDRTLPPEVGAIVDRALAFQQEQRFPDARSMQAAVRAARQRLAGGEQPSTRIGSSAMPTPVMAPGSVAQASSAIGGSASAHAMSAPPPSVHATRLSGPQVAPQSGPTLASTGSPHLQSYGGGGVAAGTLSPTTPVGRQTTSGGKSATGVAVAIAALLGVGGAVGLYFWSQAGAGAASGSAPTGVVATQETAADPPAPIGSEAAPAATPTEVTPAPSALPTAASASAEPPPAASPPAATGAKRPPPAVTGTGKPKQPGTDEKYGL